MFSRVSPKGTDCQLCDKPAALDIYFYGDNLADAIRRYEPTIRLCHKHLEELEKLVK
jgi:hypothetical protein